MDAQQFSRMVLTEMEEQVETLIIDYVIQNYWGNSLTSFLSQGNAHSVFGVDFSMKIPIIRIGAAARNILPTVAKRLHTSVSFPDNCEVGNAFGATILGQRAESIELVTTK